MRLIAAFALAPDAFAQKAASPFELRTLASPGRTAFAEIADLDGDGLGDVVSASFTKLPPEQRRTLRVHFQRADGSLPKAPDWTAPLPDDAAAYDFVAAQGEREDMLFLRRDRVTRLSLAGRAAAWSDVTLPGTTLAVAADERGIDRLRLAREGFGPEPLLLVPGLGEVFAVRLDGRVEGRLAAQSRANFWVPPRPGFLFSDSESDLYFEHPRIDVADVDGDRRGDVVVSNRHEVRVFLGREQGGFAAQPSERHLLRRLSENDHVRATGAARADVRDWNGDGLADLVVSTTRGGLMHARTKTTLHVNRGGRWDVTHADQTYDVDGGWAATSFEDVDGDGRLEFVEARLSLHTLELVEILITRAIDPELRVYRPAAALFEPAAAFQRTLTLSISFETQRTMGFLPGLIDLNGDGRLDLIAPTDGTALEIHLGAQGPALAPRAIRQLFDSTGVIRYGDLDRDHLLDLVLHDPRRPDTPIRIGLNQGTLPGTHAPPELRPAGPRARGEGGAAPPHAAR
jgi:hypothetical protein